MKTWLVLALLCLGALADEPKEYYKPFSNNAPRLNPVPAQVVAQPIVNIAPQVRVQVAAAPIVNPASLTLPVNAASLSVQELMAFGDPSQPVATAESGVPPPPAPGVVEAEDVSSSDVEMAMLSASGASGASGPAYDMEVVHTVNPNTLREILEADYDDREVVLHIHADEVQVVKRQFEMVHELEDLKQAKSKAKKHGYKIETRITGVDNE